MNIESLQAGKHHRLYVLDFLRATAITFVVITHYNFLWLPGGGVGVSIFFCLSGFLIGKMLLFDRVTMPQFLIRRFFRIYPAYLAMIIFQLTIMLAAGHERTADYIRALPSLLFFIRMPDWIGMGVGIFWTLQVEMAFYLLIPFILKFAAHNVVKYLVAIIVASFIYKFLESARLVPLPSYSLLSLVYWADGLVYGVLVAYFYKTEIPQLNPFDDFLRRMARPILWTLVATTFAIAYFVPSIGRIWPIQSSAVSAITAVGLFIYFRYGGISLRVHKSIQVIAIVSYSLYLCHSFPLDYRALYPVVSIFGLPGTSFLLLATAILATLALYFCIERPGVKLGRRFENFVIGKYAGLHVAANKVSPANHASSEPNPL